MQVSLSLHILAGTLLPQQEHLKVTSLCSEVSPTSLPFPTLTNRQAKLSTVTLLLDAPHIHCLITTEHHLDTEAAPWPLASQRSLLMLAQVIQFMNSEPTLKSTMGLSYRY